MKIVIARINKIKSSPDDAMKKRNTVIQLDSKLWIGDNYRGKLGVKTYKVTPSRIHSHRGSGRRKTRHLTLLPGFVRIGRSYASGGGFSQG